MHAEAMFTLDFYESDFPSLLKEIKDPPHRLYYQGDLTCLDRPCVAVVGTRHATPRGLSLARTWAKTMSEVGLTIVSGLAYGIDAAAHEGALEAGGPTVAVLAHGIEDVQPRGNLDLARRIVDGGGLILSEHCGEGRVFARDYLVRNRIIAGLCQGTLVVEAPYQSGALNTATHANDYGRDVWCVPGRITDVASQGCLKRLREGGASMVLNVEDILECYGITLKKMPLGGSLSFRVIEYLRRRRCAEHAVADELNIERGQLMKLLFSLEISGKISKGPDGLYSAPP